MKKNENNPAVKAEVERLNSLFLEVDNPGWDNARDISLVKSAFRRALILLNIITMTGNQKGSGAFVNVVDKLYWIVKDADKNAPAQAFTDDDSVTIGYELTFPVPAKKEGGKIEA